MGIRVTKFLGYGLTDVAFEGYEQNDPRLNLSALDRLWEETDKTIDGYLDWLLEQPKDEYGIGPAYLDQFAARRREERPTKRHGLDDCFAWGVEYRLGNVFAVQPFSCPDWRRHDDPIDWIEETYRESPAQTDHVEQLPHGLYPFNGLYMDARDGRRLPNEVMPFIRLVSHARENGEDASAFAESAMEPGYFERLGYADAAEAVAQTVPLVPEEIQMLCKYVGVFTDDTAWTQLRPLLYVYWG